MKKFNILFTLIIVNFHANSQIIINPYKDYVTPTALPSPLYKNTYTNPQELFTTFNQAWGWNYTGEYEIYIGDLYWKTAFPSNDITYDIETIGFPFMLNCFDDEFNECADCSSSVRNLVMPDNTHVYNPNTYTWGNYLFRISEGEFTSGGLSVINPGLNAFHQTLVSNMFNDGTPFDSQNNDRNYLPHTAHKINLYLHCGSGDIISKLSFIYDNTRGRMRFYPFYTNNCPGSTSSYHDVIYRPNLVVNTDVVNTNGVMYYNDSEDNANWITDNTTNIGTINYFNVDEIDDMGCNGYEKPIPPNELFHDQSLLTYFKPYPGPASLFTCYLYQDAGATLAGYGNPSSPNDPLVYTNQSQTIGKHTYTIDQDINLNDINDAEKIIYNPSEADVTATNLHFPSYYTFKTIRGTYPTAAQVQADNIADNGGPFTDLRNVPVTTDLYSENANDPANDHLYASRYYLQSGSMLTMDLCVKIFDAVFDVNQGATMIFEDYSQILGKEDKSGYDGRYKIQGLSGAILRNYADIQYVQNGNITQTTPLNYIAKYQIHAGNNVDPDTEQDDGDYDVHSGADVTFKAGDYVHLTNGFSVQGGNFHAYTSSITAPGACAFPAPERMANAKSPEDESSLSSLKIYPNPSSEKIMVKLTPYISKQNATIAIIDAMGRETYRQNATIINSKAEIDIHSLPAGFYSLKVYNDSQFASGSFVKE